MGENQKWMGYIAAFWGIAGITVMLLMAIFRLAPAAISTFDYPLGLIHYIVLAAFVVFMGHSEGYKGFQQSFAPRVARRSTILLQSPTPVRLLLAPFYLIGYFQAGKRVLAMAYGVTIGVIVLIIAVRWVEQPWRGIIDIGVIFGLSWGILACLYQFYGALLAHKRSTGDRP